MEQAKGSVAYFCPECGSASTEYSGLIGGQAKCNVCKWSGPKDKLLAHTFAHEHGSDQETFRAMLNDMRKAYSTSAQTFGGFLLKWGFFDGTNTKTLARYMAAMALASVEALLKTRADIEQERVDGN